MNDIKKTLVTTCVKCRHNLAHGIKWTICPRQGRILTRGLDSANAYHGAGECILKEEKISE